MVVLYKTEEGDIYCSEITEKGLAAVEAMNSGLEEDDGYWAQGGTIVLDELEEILDRQV